MTAYYPTVHCYKSTFTSHYPKIYIPPKEGEELVDPKKRLEPVCINKCKFWSAEYLACVDRYRVQPEKTGDCEPQYAGYCHCVDRCDLMLLAKELCKFLAECIENKEDEKTIRNIMVATLDGGVLGSARIPKDLLQEEALETTTALLVSLFTEHSSLSLNFRTFIIDCENSKAVVGGLGALVLSVWGESNSTSGALMAKFELIHAALVDTLQDLY